MSEPVPEKHGAKVRASDEWNRSSEETGELAHETIFGSNAPPRVLSVLDIVAAGFNICNAWSGLAATLFLGFISGGPVTIIWGSIVATFVTGCCVLSLAELSAKYPTAGGQYHWTHILAPTSIRRAASYAAAVTNVFSWLAITASVCVIIPQIIIGMAVSAHPGPPNWIADRSSYTGTQNTFLRSTSSSSYIRLRIWSSSHTISQYCGVHLGPIPSAWYSRCSASSPSSLHASPRRPRTSNHRLMFGRPS